MTDATLTANQRHYEKNRETISKERRARYQTDEAYRQAQLERRKAYTEKKRLESGKPPLEEVPEKYRFTISDIIGKPPLLGRSTISGWVSKGHLPEPAKYNGVYYFTREQAQSLREFVKKVAGHKRVFTSGAFDDDIQKVRESFN